MTVTSNTLATPQDWQQIEQKAREAVDKMLADHAMRKAKEMRMQIPRPQKKGP